MGLLLGFALVLLGSCLFNFPAAPINYATTKGTTDALENPAALGFVVAQYVILLGLCALITVIFTSVCIAVQMRTSASFSMLGQRPSLSLNPFPMLRACLWYTLIVFLIIGLAIFDYYIFDGKEALFPFYFWSYS